MKIENIIKKLEKDGLEVVSGEFDYKECWMCQGTALIDWIDGEVTVTNARYVDVVKQIKENKSHIYTKENGKKQLTDNNKLGY